LKVFLLKVSQDNLTLCRRALYLHTIIPLALHIQQPTNSQVSHAQLYI